MAFYFSKRIGSLESRLQVLRVKQKLKVQPPILTLQVEELKNMTAYYKTKGLLDRFDTEASAAKKRPDALQPAAQHAERNPQHAPARPLPQSTISWTDRLVDAIVGDNDRNSQYALICDKCFVHNGLVLPEELKTKKYICPNCGYFHNKDSVAAEAAPEATHSVPILLPPNQPALSVGRGDAEQADDNDQTPKQSSPLSATIRRKGRAK